MLKFFLYLFPLIYFLMHSVVGGPSSMDGPPPTWTTIEKSSPHTAPILTWEPVISQAEIECMAKNIYFEAAVESTAGQLAVAQVTLNRVKSKHYPNTVCEVVYEGPKDANGFPKRDRCQFSWYCDGMGDNPRAGRGWSSSQSIAKWFYDHQDRLMDITDGATHYHADWMEKYPKWAHKYRKNVRIDDHIFYKHSYRNKKKTNELTLARL